jgi:hypothetical protein
MINVTVKKHARAPVARVFAIATDFRNAPDHIRGITKMEVLTGGPVGKGTRFRETRRMFGREATAEMEVVEFDPPRSYTLVCEESGCRYRTVLTFSEKDGGTEIEFRFQAEPLTFFSKLMSFLMRPLLKPMLTMCAKDLDDIVAHAEGRSAGPATAR